jgi:hypothetical protein
MEYISSMTGKSPSTTGRRFGRRVDQGAVHMLPAIIDLNAAFVSFALTGHDGWISRRLRRAEHARRSRHQPAGARSLRAHEPRPSATRKLMPGAPWNVSRISSTKAARCWPAASAIASRRVSPAPTSAAYSCIRMRSSPRKCCARNCRTWTSSSMAWPTSSPPTSVWPSPTSPMARSPWPARRCRRCSRSWPRGARPRPRPRLAGAALAVHARKRARQRLVRRRLDAKQRADEKRLTRAVASLYEFMDRPDNAGVVSRLGIAARRAQTQIERARAGSPEYRAGLVGTIGLQPPERDH